MKKLLILFIFVSAFIKAQKTEYQFLIKDQNEENWYYSFDKQSDNGFFAWLKSEYSFENDPSTESTEFYLEFKCRDKTSSDQIVKINWREGEPEMSKKKMPFNPVQKNHISFPLFKKFCK